MEDYNWCMRMAAKFGEMARFEDEHMRRQLLSAVQDLEAKARSLQRQSEQPDSNSE